MNSPTIELLTASDALANVALSRAAGWKDVTSEWRVLHAAARVLGVREEQRLVAQGALGDYGSAATVAKMVVAPDRQGQGWGRQLLERLLEPALERGIPVGLCATDQGLPLYDKLGFRVSGEVVILVGEPHEKTAVSSAIAALTGVAEAIELDRAFVSCDRSRMLGARFAEANAAFTLVEPGESGFALATASDGGTLVGPLLARSDAGARALARAIFAAAPGPLRIDVPAEQVNFRSWLVALGFREMSVRREMARGASRAPWQVPQRYALSTQAWG